ncbi:unnamed protein product [Linum trigynum]|uniref:Uncharacterized protein n=1 Tax=Linum trigynum TaxID=586398 RepID=A0AAV2F638_9ROSI
MKNGTDRKPTTNVDVNGLEQRRASDNEGEVPRRMGQLVSGVASPEGKGVEIHATLINGSAEPKRHGLIDRCKYGVKMKEDGDWEVLIDLAGSASLGKWAGKMTLDMGVGLVNYLQELDLRQDGYELQVRGHGKLKWGDDDWLHYKPMPGTQEGKEEVEVRIFDGALWAVSSINVAKHMGDKDHDTKSESHHFAAYDIGVRGLLEVGATGYGSYVRIHGCNWKYRKRDHHHFTLMSFYCKLGGSFFFIDPG